jgi:hypothetical protein
LTVIIRLRDKKVIIQIIALCLMYSFPLTSFADDRAYFEAKSQALNQEIRQVKEKYYGKFDNLVTKRIDNHITPETSNEKKFLFGVVEGVPKSILDVSMLGYSLLKRGQPTNIYISSMNSYYKVKDNPEKYKILVKNSPQIAVALAGAFYQEGKDYLKLISTDYRAAGNLVGGFVALGGMTKVIGATAKSLPVAAKTINTVPKTVGSVSKTTPVIKAPTVYGRAKGLNGMFTLPKIKLGDLTKSIAWEIKGRRKPPMDLDYVKKVAEKAGIGLDGVTVKIIKKDHPTLVGRADKNTIILYEGAFDSLKKLVTTTGHERIHVAQFDWYKAPHSISLVAKNEVAAYATEKQWWQYFKLNDGNI